MRSSILPLAALALAACSQSEATPDRDATSAPETSAPAGTPAPPAAAGIVPAAFRGVWDSVGGSCNPASDLRVEIKERAFEFYESHGEVKAVTVESPESIVIELAMEGEGDSWTLRRRFTLSEGGTRLTPAALGGEEFEPMPLKRCPG